MLAWRTVHVFWTKRSYAKLYQVRVHKWGDTFGPMSNFLLSLVTLMILVPISLAH